VESFLFFDLFLCKQDTAQVWGIVKTSSIIGRHQFKGIQMGVTLEAEVSGSLSDGAQLLRARGARTPG
jgi:hypothetical protein